MPRHTDSPWLPFVGASIQPRWSHSSSRLANGESTTIDSRFITLDGSVGLTRLVASDVGITGEAFYTHDEVSTSSITSSPYDSGLRFGFSVFIP